MVYYHHTDHLGTTEVVTDGNGTVVWEAGYEAFGSVLNERGESKFTPSYTGKFFDMASDLYYFNARWYDSELGKFTSSDPIRDGINWWNYCNGNPLTLLDWTGLAYFNGKDWVSSSTPAQRHRNKLDITDYLIPEGNNNRPGDKIVQVKGVVIHWTEVKNQSPKETINYWINEGRKKNGRPGSAHFVVGIDGKAFRAIPEDEFALHSGENKILKYLYTNTAKSLISDNKDTVNYFLLGIEMEPNKNREEGGGFDQRTIESTSLLTAMLLNAYNLNAESDLYRHYDMTGKDCPLYFVDNEKWKKFVDMVKEDQKFLRGLENE
jgi:N-acetylmuramoyl-L-alanine amidase